MTDRELLELAAKAAGHDIWAWDEEHNLLVLDGWQGRSYWNPLTDDGDALRLAVKLRLAVWTAVDNGRPPMYALALGGGYPNTIRAEELHDTDPYAATRRAIVRAAAEIGKNK
jgi:hypothetical protein